MPPHIGTCRAYGTFFSSVWSDAVKNHEITCQTLFQTMKNNVFEIKSIPKSVFFIACDVTSLEAVETLYDQALSIFDNTESIDLWVNNAGVMGEKEGWKKCMDINLCGVLNGLHVASAKASATRPLTVINVASILGLFNAKQPKGWAYNTSKSAVVTATRCMGPSWPYVRIVSLVFFLLIHRIYCFHLLHITQ